MFHRHLMYVYTAFWQELQPPRLEQVGVSMALIWEKYAATIFPKSPKPKSLIRSISRLISRHRPYFELRWAKAPGSPIKSPFGFVAFFAFWGSKQRARKKTSREDMALTRLKFRADDPFFSSCFWTRLEFRADDPFFSSCFCEKRGF